MNKNIIYVVFLILVFAACDLKEDYEQIDSKVVEYAGEWYVKYTNDSLGTSGYSTIITYNTADDVADQIWLSDQGHYWDYKVKIPVNGNVENMTFGSSAMAQNAVKDYEIDVLVENGIVIKDGVKNLPSGAITDSIYFEIYFEDLEDATNVANDRIIVAGYRRTGFLEDEH